MEFKVCTKCGLEKELSEFHYRKDRDKYCEICYECKHKINHKETKVCIKCGKEKNINEFFKNKVNKDGYNGTCISCRYEYRKLNRDTCRKYWKRWRDKPENRVKIKEKEEKYRKKDSYREYHRVYMKEKREDNESNLSKYGKRYQQTKQYKDYCKKYNQDVYHRVIHALRYRLYYYVTKEGLTKVGKTMDIVGCTPSCLRLHLEAQFKEEMSWDNYGKEGWEIDHIIPCAAFDLSNEEQQKKCFHYTNLQPLWVRENQSKSSIYNGIKHVRKTKSNIICNFVEV